MLYRNSSQAQSNPFYTEAEVLHIFVVVVAKNMNQNTFPGLILFFSLASLAWPLFRASLVAQW